MMSWMVFFGNNDQDYFPIVCQHYITSLLYSEQGRQGPLINMVHQSRKDKIDIEKYI